MSAEHATTMAAQLGDAELLDIVGPVAVHCARTSSGAVPRPGLPHLAPDQVLGPRPRHGAELVVASARG